MLLAQPKVEKEGFWHEFANWRTISIAVGGSLGLSLLILGTAACIKDRRQRRIRAAEIAARALVKHFNLYCVSGC